ncbi:MAG: NAD(P)H-dependent oxidoreductase subunit E [Candidatus Omnitrophica bacterium]|nr:NAD(P)H-dependent oxidoreductase subunit E [Candidatus Omnitrophota bacterium]MCM8829218.1 NAD(P)H-dependent oxidoreductase subunit E [Candidatus Omnitrophota bacterium]
MKIDKYKNKKGYYLELLQDIQGRKNYIPVSLLKKICKQLDIPESKIFGVLTFYSQFTTEKRGKYLVKLCDGTACHVKGAREVKRILERKYGLTNGKTTADGRFTLQEVACLGSCFLAPVMMINQRYFGNLTPEKALSIFKNLK